LTFVSCGGNKVFLWDIRNGKQLFSACNNKKTVSGVHVINNGSRFMTTSFDQYLKVYKSDTFELTYQDKMASSIQCFDVTASGQHIFVGLEGGKLISKTRTKQSL
jgi:WD40 repeat protein